MAMKIINRNRMKGMLITKEKSAYNQLLTEIAILKKINHPNVVKLYEIIDDEKSDKLFLVMEYVNGGTLLTKIKSGFLNPRSCWAYFRGLVLGLEYCHEKAGVVHRDIKPENIMIDSHGNVKITDFGVSHMMDASMNDELDTVVGSHYFMAPEICNSEKFNGKPSDIWAAGVTLYYMITGKLPFNGANIAELYKNISETECEYPESISTQQKDLLIRLLDKVPERRIKICDIKAHVWVTHNGALKMQDLADEKIVAQPHEIKEAISLLKIYTKIKSVMHNRLQNLRKKKAQLKVT
jgi:serine/threonine protein kinase